MINNHLVGLGPATVKRFILSEGSGFTIPPNSTILYSEVVANSDGDEILELWIAVPSGVSSQHGPTKQGARTIYSNTVVYDEDDDDTRFDPDWGLDEEPDPQESTLRAQIEQDIANNLNREDEDEYYYD